MRQIIRTLAAAALIAAAGQAPAAGCYADYKAKRDNPLRLHYGVIELHGECTPANARAEAAARLRAQGWTLLSIISVFGPEGLEERKANAGPYYLRY
ncbi:hypothetical protein [Jhaorihella thermophila]|uniref:DUF4177 domain-containing protein n=1 Tax=Jhaorihella thermophila TaxID=488547 RepID=A0A1H5UZ26_9RHOB|nr:hypothetical protein [Jhaorihella thermophila]SEF79658.1 hypothetical protein SAMN05421751_10511 [Jhaorihella thermophila]